MHKVEAIKKEFDSMATDNTDLIGISFAATGSHLVGSPRFDQLFRHLSSAKTIVRHLDFYNWLQDEICDYLPHEVLLAAWGNFEYGNLSYDAASSLPGIDTQFFNDLPFLDVFLSHLHTRARMSGPGWYVLQDFDDAAADSDIGDGFRFLKIAGARMKSALVYAMSDERDGADCLYVFYSRKSRIEINPLTLDLIMPHVDAALRRVKCLSSGKATANDSQCSLFFSLLSEREQEVLNWVGEGKSNLEIGAILGISHNTVKNHLKRIFKKMGVTARSQAVQVYINSNTLES